MAIFLFCLVHMIFQQSAVSSMVRREKGGCFLGSEHIRSDQNVSRRLSRVPEGITGQCTPQAHPYGASENWGKGAVGVPALVTDAEPFNPSGDETSSRRE